MSKFEKLHKTTPQPLSFLIVYYATHDPKIIVSENNILAVIGKKYSLYIYAFHGIAVTICSKTVLSIAQFNKNAGSFAVLFYHIAKPILVFLMALLISWIYVRVSQTLTGKLKACVKATAIVK